MVQKTKLNVTHQALLDLAKSEYKYLTESKAHDGFDLSELQVLDGTDEELHVAFSLTLNEKQVNFKYSLGFDADEGGYWPYVEVEAGNEQDPIAFSTKHVGGNGFVVGEKNLLESIDLLDQVSGEARFEAFQWLTRQIADHPRT